MLQRWIVCAANRYKGVNYPGARHHNCFKLMVAVGLDPREYLPDNGTEQGFIDQHDVFMTREEAMDVALISGQVGCRPGGKMTVLYSEDLY